MTVSEFSRQEIVTLLGVAPERVSVIPGGVDGRFSMRADPTAAATVLGLARPYVLTVASATSRKNLAALGPAAARLALAKGIELVAAGGERPQFAGRVDAVGLRPLGHVDDALLPGLYAGALAFVLPSLYEGFGLHMHRGDGQRGPGGRRRPRRAARDVRGRGAARRPHRSHRHRGGAGAG